LCVRDCSVGHAPINSSDYNTGVFKIIPNGFATMNPRATTPLVDIPCKMDSRRTTTRNH
jgi:hypothetical protein